jgi:ParB/RepB/Spo0J family partition protein
MIELVPHSEIIIPTERQRTIRHDEALTELAASILETGQIQPVVVDDGNILIAGERRLSAIRHLVVDEKHDGQVLVRRLNPESDFHRHAIELEENIKRIDLTPAERDLAISEYTRLRQAQKGKPKRHVGGGHSQADTARELGISEATVSDAMKSATIIEHHQKTNPELAKQIIDEGWTRNAIVNKFKQDRIREIRTEIANRATEKLAGSLDNIVSQGDALNFLDGFVRESVDLFLTDIPFGMDVFKSADLRESSLGTQWEDDPALVKEFVHELIPRIYNVLKENTHAFIFTAWHQTHWIEQIAKINGFVFEYPPAIWDREQMTPSRQPSLTFGKTYEYIVHLRKGSPVWPDNLGSDVVRGFRRPTNPKYPSQKPPGVMGYFIERGCMEGELVVDCCCGSGSTGVDAITLNRRVMLNDINEEAVKIAKSRIALECKEML